jgi:hypothetical protein
MPDASLCPKSPRLPEVAHLLWPSGQLTLLDTPQTLFVKIARIWEPIPGSRDRLNRLLLNPRILWRAGCGKNRCNYEWPHLNDA